MVNYILLFFYFISLCSVENISGKDSCKKTCEKECPPCDLRCSTGYLECGTSIFIPRSVGANTARELVGWEDQLYRPYCENYSAWSATFEYSRSFDEKKLARDLFCTDCLTFAGSQSKYRENDIDIVADYFGLPTNFVGTLKIKPTIENYIIDIQNYISLAEVLPGLYVRMHAPITHARYNLGLDECVACAPKFRGSDTFPIAYMYSSNESVTDQDCFFVTEPNAFHKQNNCTTHSLRTALSGDFLFGDVYKKWKYGKFSFCPKEKLRLADLDIILGYNFVTSDRGHFGLYIQTVVPTGNKPKSKYFFEPMIGNGKHWGLGGGLSTHIMFYDDGFSNGTHLGLYVEGNMIHLFKNHQKRSFDFTKNGFLSRYMLLKEYDINDQYTGRMINAINFCTRKASVQIPYQIDLSAKLYFGSCGWMFDAGYNFYIRDAEKICIKTDCPCEIDQQRWGIKGTQGVAYINGSVENNVITTTDLSLLNNTEPKADMFIARKPSKTNLTDETIAGLMLAYNNDLTLNNSTSPVDPLEVVLVNNNKPKIISCKDLNVNSAAQPRMITHKAFGYFGYQWYEHDYSPHIGIGAEVEFAQKDERALNQFGIWIKAGALF